MGLKQGLKNGLFLRLHRHGLPMTLAMVVAETYYPSVTMPYEAGLVDLYGVDVIGRVPFCDVKPKRYIQKAVEDFLRCPVGMSPYAMTVTLYGKSPEEVLVEVYGLELDEQNEAVGDIPPNGDRESAISLAESGNPYIDEIVEGGPTYTERSLMSVHP